MHPQNDNFDEALGFRLKKLRQMRRMSQSALAEMLGITFQQVQKYENGKSRMSPERIQKCAQIFGVPVAHFFDNSAIQNLGNIDKRIITLATAIASLPTEELQKRVYSLVQGITDTFLSKENT